MYRRLSVLSGLAILAVVVNHAGGFGYVAMFWWTHRYRAVTVPNYDAVGSLTYFISDLIHLTTVFAVPAFLFISGFFISYAARASKTEFGWRLIRPRLVALLIPYTIWSLVNYAWDILINKQVLRPGEYVLSFLLLGANGGMYFIPVLVIFYLISPWLVRWSHDHWRAILVSCSVLMVVPILFRYLRLIFGPLPWLETLIVWTPDQLIFRWAIYFPLGIIAGLKMDAFRSWIVGNRHWLLAGLIASYVIFFLETQIIFINLPDHWRPGPSSIFLHLYSLFLILAFLAYDRFQLPMTRQITQLGGKSYGIYLTHFLFMTAAARAVYHFFPWLLSQPILFQIFLFVVALGLSLLFMALIARTFLRPAYTFLFG